MKDSAVDFTQLNKQTQTSVKPSPKFEEMIKNKKKDTVEKIQLTNEQMLELVSYCVRDLMVPRKLIVHGAPTVINIVKEYDEKRRFITFSCDIDELNSILKIKEKDLGDFFCSFFFTNIQKYCLELYNAIPVYLPIFEINRSIVIKENTISIELH
jgi:hypothetical protein